MAFKAIHDMNVHEIYDHMSENHGVDLHVGEMKLFDLETVIFLHTKLHEEILHHHSERQYGSRTDT